MTLVYLDTETTGLDHARHDVWEIGWAVDDGPVRAAFVEHSLVGAHPRALQVGGYWDRHIHSVNLGKHDFEAECELRAALVGATIVGANPAFDAAFLAARWGEAPWDYRLLDVESMAAAVMPPSEKDRVPGLKDIADYLDSLGYVVPAPDHTAAGDVATVRACHLGLLWAARG
jgi:hypothetical protein